VVLELLEARTVPSFLPAVNYAAGPGPASMAVGDFNADGLLDLAVADYFGGVSVLLGQGDGSFLPAVNYPAGTYPRSVAVGDFNGDGILDLAVANQGTWPNYTDGSVSVLLGKRDGTFLPAVNYPAGTNPVSVAVGDFNGDGWPDLAVANYFSNDVSILLNDATWTGGPGFPRIVGIIDPNNPVIDIGAFEVQSTGGPGRATSPHVQQVHTDVAALLSPAVLPSRAPLSSPTLSNVPTQSTLPVPEVPALDGPLDWLNQKDAGLALLQPMHQPHAEAERWGLDFFRGDELVQI
jgi:hypothetical protein